MSDRVAVMSRGRIEQVGEPLELYEHPRTRFVAEFVGESNFLEGTVAADEGGGALLLTRSGLRLPIGSGSAQVGEGVSVVLRPEKIALTAGGAGLEGEVAEVVYLGEATRYVVRLGSGETLSAKRQNSGPSAALKAGTRVRLYWDPDAAIVHPR